MNYSDFQEIFIKWINRINKKTLQVFCLNSIMGGFEAETGVCQGWLPSLSLFELYFEQLIKYLEKEINGVIIENVAMKLNSFVEKVTMYTETEHDI